MVLLSDTSAGLQVFAQQRFFENVLKDFGDSLEINQVLFQKLNLKNE